MEYDIASAVFNVTFNCNDCCSFCFNKKHINTSPYLTLSEIKNNYFYVRKKYNVSQIIISGGEPTLHPDFWEMMDFFYNETEDKVRPSLNTNSLHFHKKEEAVKLEEFLKKTKKQKKQLSLSFSNVSTLKSPDSQEKKKIKGLKNALLAGLKSKTRTLVVIIITKNNYKSLPDIGKFLREIINSVENGRDFFRIQLRNLYANSHYMTEKQIQENLPKNFEEIKPSILDFLQETLEKDIDTALFNIPVCLIQDEMDISLFKKKHRKMSKELRMRVEADQQFHKIKAGIFQSGAHTTEACQQCTFNNSCNKVDHAYIERGFIKKLIPFT